MPDRYVQTTPAEVAPADEETIHAGIVPGDPVRYEWMTFTHYAEKVGASLRVGDRECCGCHRTIPVSVAWTVQPVDANNLICGPGYIFCGVCRLGEDAAHAYRHADIDFKTRTPKHRPAAPDVNLDRPVGI